jgi:hypothetical protein
MESGKFLHQHNINHTIKHIALNNPCTANWAEMTPKDNGRFCSNCQKSVIDFSALKDDEVIAYLSKHNGVCGRFERGQMERINTQIADKSITQGRLRWAAVIAGLLFISENSKATDKSIHTYTAQTLTDTGRTVPQAPRIITGKVTSAESFALSGIAISTGGVSVQTTSGLDGSFTISVPADAGDSIVFRHQTYQTYTLKLQPGVSNYTIIMRKPYSQAVEITRELYGTMGGLVVVRHPLHKRVYYSVKRFFTSLF